MQPHKKLGHRYLTSKCIIESGNQEMSMSGREAFCIKSITDSGLKFIQAHTESGLSKLKTEGTWFFEAADIKVLQVNLQ